MERRRGENRDFSMEVAEEERGEFEARGSRDCLLCLGSLYCLVCLFCLLIRTNENTPYSAPGHVTPLANLDCFHSAQKSC